MVEYDLEEPEQRQLHYHGITAIRDHKQNSFAILLLFPALITAAVVVVIGFGLLIVDLGCTLRSCFAVISMETDSKLFLQESRSSVLDPAALGKYSQYDSSMIERATKHHVTGPCPRSPYDEA